MKRCVALLLTLLLAAPLMPAAAEVTANWYEVFVRSYQDSDGDGIGDLPGLTARLDYIHDLGYRGIWLMPVMPSPSYHKYDVTDYCAVDPEYGTMEDMRALVAAAHERGIRVIVDLPVNHTSTRHPWFLAAAQAVREGRTDDPAVGRYHFLDHAENGYVELENTGWYYEERFAGGGMPDLDLDSAAVRADVEGILRFWLADVGVDGFRLDAVTSYYTDDRSASVAFLAWLKETCEAIRPGTFLVGEAWTGLETIAEYYASGADAFFLFPASQAEGFVAKAVNGRSGAARYTQGLERVYALLPEGSLAPFLANHDTGRAVGLVRGRKAPERVKMAYGLLSLIGGSTFTYYGEEIGMAGSGEDPNKRLAMYWSDGDLCEQPPGVTAVEYPYPPAEEQLEDEDSILAWYRRVNEMKLACPALTAGRTEFLFREGSWFAFTRTDGAQTCCAAVNLSTADRVSFTVPGQWTLAADLETLGGAASVRHHRSGTLVTVPPYAIVVLTEKEVIP